MRKFVGWIQIVCFSIFLVAIFFCIYIGFSPDEEEHKALNHWVLAELLIVAILLVVGIINGLKKIKIKKVPEIIKYEKELKINLSGKIEYNDYRNLILGLTFKKPFYLVALVMLILAASTFFIYDRSITKQVDYSSVLINFTIFLILWPILTIYNIKKIYKTNKLFNVNLDYCLNNDSIKIKGDTVDSIQNWTHFFKIKETKLYFMLYQGEAIASLLDKRMFTDNELTEFRQFIKSLNVIRE